MVPIMENRKEPREKRNIKIRIKDEEGVYPASVITISKTGISVKTCQIFPAYKVVDILVKIAQQLIPIKASVRWVNEVPGAANDERYEIGFLLQSPPSEYVQHFDWVPGKLL